MSDEQAISGETSEAYQVLARKYRPQSFSDLIGQDAMVRTLRNAFAADRIAHAFVMTGVRGVGKTTTARIIAKGLNCIGADGQGGVTTEPCGVCGPCVAIAEGRHVDVQEIDSATHTQVENMREILAGVAYRPTEVRYKIYIFDEVHMLSKHSFNALLKTLEEPPDHVKFIFATTEIRQVPVTILSRCQRFDLKRIEADEMIADLERIAGLEGAEIERDALALITRAAEGSMRDAQSLLDQAIAHGVGVTTADQVRAMLGLADRGRVLDLFEMIMRGAAAEALEELAGQYGDGADPLAVLRDLAEVTHWISVVKISPSALEDPTVSPDERQRGQSMAEGLPMRALSRMWQMLLKALEEVAVSPNAMMAAEMAVIRLTHVADLPGPEDLVRKLKDATPPPATPQPTMPSGGGGGTQAIAQAAPAVALQPGALDRYARFEDVVGLIRTRRDVKLLIEVETHLRLAKYTPGRIEFEPGPAAPPDLAARLAGKLQTWTGTRWGVSVVSEGGAETIAEVREAKRTDLEAQAIAHPLVSAAFEAFPGAKIVEVRPPDMEVDDNAGIVPIDPEDVDDDWDPLDPFEEEY